MNLTWGNCIKTVKTQPLKPNQQWNKTAPVTVGSCDHGPLTYTVNKSTIEGVYPYTIPSLIKYMQQSELGSTICSWRWCERDAYLPWSNLLHICYWGTAPLLQHPLGLQVPWATDWQFQWVPPAWLLHFWLPRRLACHLLLVLHPRMGGSKTLMESMPSTGCMVTVRHATDC